MKFEPRGDQKDRTPHTPNSQMNWFLLQFINKMELLQSQAPVYQELSGSSASARHGTFDIGH